MNDISSNPHPVQCTYTPALFDDVDQFQELSSQIGWNLESTQLSPGANRIRFDQLAFPGLEIAHHHVNQSMHDVFEVPENQVIFTMCRTKLPVVWCGKHLQPSSTAILHPRRTHFARLPAGWDTYEFSVSADLIAITELFPPDFFAQTTRMERAILPLVEPQTGQFLKVLDVQFSRVGNARGGRAAAISQSGLYDFILHGLIQVVDAGLAAGRAELPRPARRADLVVKARELMLASLQSNLTADQIAQTLNVSYRVLNYAFHDSLGVSPYQYFMTQRLHEVRRQLKNSDATVTEACMNCGFSTPSRLARQYRRLFGELPSETKSQFKSYRFNN